MRKKLGDVIEIPTSKGLSYVQYTHENKASPVLGSLIRVLEGFSKTRPSNEELSHLIKKPHRFQTFCPVHHSVNLGFFELVGNFPVPDFAKKFPTFKSSNTSHKIDPEKKKWWLWDGEKSWKVGELSVEEQKKYPFKGGFNDTGLVTAIENGEWGGRKLC